MSWKRVLAAAFACMLILEPSAQGASDRIIFVVRHAERADALGAAGQPMVTDADPPLSRAGHTRARRLASMLRSANVTHIFTTEYLRTRQTAAPLAEALHLEVVNIPAKDVNALVARLRETNGTTLVVGHSNTVPQLLKELGVATAVTIGERDFDNLFVVVRAPSGESTLVRLRY